MSSAWYVNDSSEPDWEDGLGKRYEDYEIVEALADFFRRANEKEDAILKWSM